MGLGWEDGELAGVKNGGRGTPEDALWLVTSYRLILRWERLFLLPPSTSTWTATPCRAWERGNWGTLTETGSLAEDT